jgi:hypothetical protein
MLFRDLVAEPSPKLDRLDDRELHERINSLTSHEAKKRGLGKSTLHYLRRNGRIRTVRIDGGHLTVEKAKKGKG